MPQVRYLVRGRVQGVGFRWFVWSEADRLGLRGFARNLPDGSVEVMAEGAAEALEGLCQSLARGPKMARVDRVERHDIRGEVALPKRFEIS